jgi:D-alanyl-D-alanine carboxypeptidase
MKPWGLATVAAAFFQCATGAAVEVPGQQSACEHLAGARAAAHVPGLTAAVARADSSIIEFAMGHSAGDASAIAPGAKFLSGSIGKTYVAVVAIDLHSRGVLDLDAPVAGLLGSEAWFRALPNSCCITLRHLLNHSSGLPQHVEMPAFQKAISQRIRSCADCVFTALEAIKFVGGTKPLFAPGQGFAYSETNYLVAGLALEKASGSSYYELLKERILGRLSLTETLPSDRNVIPGLVSGELKPHTNYFGLESASTMRDGKLLYNPGLEWTGGGLAASSADLVRWARALYTGKALPEPYLHELFTSVIAENRHGRYGLGVGIQGRGAQVVYGHTGSIPGYRASMHYFPARNIAVAVQFNADPDRDEQLLADLEKAALEASERIRLVAPASFTGIRCP